MTGHSAIAPVSLQSAPVSLHLALQNADNVIKQIGDGVAEGLHLEGMECLYELPFKIDELPTGTWAHDAGRSSFKHNTYFFAPDDKLSDLDVCSLQLDVRTAIYTKIRDINADTSKQRILSKVIVTTERISGILHVSISVAVKAYVPSDRMWTLEEGEKVVGTYWSFSDAVCQLVADINTTHIRLHWNGTSRILTRYAVAQLMRKEQEAALQSSLADANYVMLKDGKTRSSMTDVFLMGALSLRDLNGDSWYTALCKELDLLEPPTITL